MEKAFNPLESLSQDEKTRQRHESRQKDLHDYATAIETAERKGRQEGRAEGCHEGTDDMIRRMLVAGLPVE